MYFSDTNFFLFCTAVVAVNALLWKAPKWRARWLALSSALFLISWNWQSLAMAVAWAAVTYASAIWIENRRARALIVALVLLQVAGLCAIRFLVKFNLDRNLDRDFFSFQTGILTIGVSYYVLQNISYLVEVFRANERAERNFVHFFIYSAFFPKVLMGPIERSRDFLPQISDPKIPRKFGKPLYLLALGLFKKLVIASRIADLSAIVNSHFLEKPVFVALMIAYSGMFAFYCDFSACNDIGRGIAALLGFRLKRNFLQPYFASNPSDYWNRWHRTLGLWMRDYVYFPLLLKLRNTYAAIAGTFAVVALWHGIYAKAAIWTLSWTVLLGSYVLLRGRAGNARPPGWAKPLSIGLTFNLVAILSFFAFYQVVFRHETIDFSVFYEDRIDLATRSNVILLGGIALMIAIESLESRIGRSARSDALYFALFTILSFLNALFMTGESYLFYYMHI